METLSLLLLCSLLSLTGCDEGFDPFAEGADGAALSGTLDARLDTQFVRVEPIRRAPNAEPPPPLVTATDVGSGDVLVFRDTLITTSDGETAPAAFSLLRPLPGRTYRLAAERADAAGAPSAVAVPVPARPTFRAGSVDSLAGGEIAQRLTLEGAVGPPQEVRLEYDLTDGTGTDLTSSVRYTAQAAPPEGTFTVRALLSRDADDLIGRFGEGLALRGLRLRFRLVQPPVPVENGLGAVGAVAAFAEPYTLPRATVQELGFEDEQDRRE